MEEGKEKEMDDRAESGVDDEEEEEEDGSGGGGVEAV